MMNQIMLVGKLVEIDENLHKAKISISRNYKNENGEYDTDIIPFTIWNNLSNKVAEHIKKGDIIGIKGRMQNNNNEIEIVAEKLTFLSMGKVEK